MQAISPETPDVISHQRTIFNRVGALAGRAVTVVRNGCNRMVSGCSQPLNRGCFRLSQAAKSTCRTVIAIAIRSDKCLVDTVVSSKQMFERVARALGFRGRIPAWVVLASSTLTPLLLTTALGGLKAATMFIKPFAALTLSACFVCLVARATETACQIKHLKTYAVDTQNLDLLEQTARTAHAEAVEPLTLLSRLITPVLMVAFVGIGITGAAGLLPPVTAAGIMTGCSTTAMTWNMIDKALLRCQSRILKGQEPRLRQINDAADLV